MKTKFLKIFPILIGIALIASGLVFMKLRAASEDQQSFLDFCTGYGITLNPDSPYSNWDLDTEAVMQLYHKTINDKFNEYIKKMIQAQAAAVEKNEADPNGLPPAPDEITGLPGVCDANNYSSYCVASTLLSDKSFGYMEYRRSMNCRRQSIFSSAKDQTSLYDSYTKVMIIGKGNEDAAINRSQGARVLEVSARLKAIDTEIDVAKQALDKTLVAYVELKTAWPMHKRYVQIYESLVKYRDKLVEVRHQVEELPNKFIDATTTKCT
jgi:hypothetical protein